MQLQGEWRGYLQGKGACDVGNGTFRRGVAQARTRAAGHRSCADTAVLKPTDGPGRAEAAPAMCHAPSPLSYCTQTRLHTATCTLLVDCSATQPFANVTPKAPPIPAKHADPMPQGSSRMSALPVQQSAFPSSPHSATIPYLALELLQIIAQARPPWPPDPAGFCRPPLRPSPPPHPVT